MSQAPLSIQRSCRIPVNRDLCFAQYLQLDPREYIHSDLVIEPIVQVDRPQGTTFRQIGDTQKIQFKSGAQITEEVLACLPGRQFVYRGTGFTQPLLNWLDHAKGSFEFEDDGEGATLVTWRYTFYLRDSIGLTAKRAAFQALVMNVIWQRMMSKTLANLTQIITLRALNNGAKK